MSIIHRASTSCSFGKCMVFLHAYTLNLVGFILEPRIGLLSEREPKPYIFPPGHIILGISAKIGLGPTGKIVINFKSSPISPGSASMMKVGKVAPWLGKQETGYYIFKYTAKWFCFETGLAFCHFLRLVSAVLYNLRRQPNKLQFLAVLQK